MMGTLSCCYTKEMLAEGPSVSETTKSLLNSNFDHTTSVLRGLDCEHKLSYWSTLKATHECSLATLTDAIKRLMKTKCPCLCAMT